LLRPFELHRPTTVVDASALLSTLGPYALIYAGGTEVLLLLKQNLVRADHVVDIKGISGLGEIGLSDGRLGIGATVTHRTLERSTVVREHCSTLAGVARHVANVRVRNVGTVGGNLAFADPHSDLATVGLAFDATITLRSVRGAREQALDDFVLGAYETAREPDEILTAVTMPVPSPRTVAAYVKFGLYERPTLGIAVTMTLEAAAASVTDLRLAVGCVGPRPVRVRSVEDRCRRLSLDEIAARRGELGAAAARDVDVMADLHGSSEYKRDMVRVFTTRVLATVVARARHLASRLSGRDAVTPVPALHYAHADVV
jgi:carbon-monoxide dehydrogenase medium subunit